MDAVACAALAASLNAMAPEARLAALAVMLPEARAQLLAAGVKDNAAASSAAVRDARLADLGRLEAQRKSAVWVDAEECFKSFENALLNTGFKACGGDLPRWRTAFRGVLAALKRMDEEADGLASRGMPTAEADVEAVRTRRKALRASIP